jgi:hypothetical protein
MNEIAVRHQEIQARPIQRARLAAPLNRMAYIQAISELAMNVVSESHMYSVRNLVHTIAEAERLKHSYGGNLPPAAAAVYERLTGQYLASMETILKQYGERLLAEVERASEDDSFVSWLRAWLSV